MPEQSDRDDRPLRGVAPRHRSVGLAATRARASAARRRHAERHPQGRRRAAMPTMRTSPGLEDIWQLHWAYGAGIEQNSAGVFIANVDDNQTIANALTAPPRGGGPGGGGRGPGGGVPPGAGGAPPQGAPPQGAPQGATPPGAGGPPQGGQPPAGPPAGGGGGGRVRRRRRTCRRTGSRSWRSRTVRSPCRTAATVSARRTRRRRSRADDDLPPEGGNYRDVVAKNVAPVVSAFGGRAN